MEPLGSPEHPDISIVIPVRNEAEQIEQCLHALRNQSLNPAQYEVIVVDDGSDDESANGAQRNGVRVIRQTKMGTAVARNRGIAEARGAVVVFTDADCIADRHWLERLTAPLLRADVQGTVGRIVSRQNQWLARLVQAELDGRYERMRQHQRIDFINTGNCGFNRAILAGNPFDESFPFIEDVELSFRLARGGCRMIFVQDALVEHRHPQSLPAYLRRKFRYASFAPMLYRRFPDKALSDSRTPVYLRWQLLLTALAVVLAFASISWHKALPLGLVCFVGAAALSFSFCRTAARQSLALGFIAPVFSLMGNLSFIAGMARGFIMILVKGK